MIRRITLLILCLLCLASLPGRADGYWVLKKTTSGSGQTRPSKKLQWKIKPGTATLKEKIKILEQWGTAEKINPVKLKAAQELRGRIDDMLANTGEGDSQALIEFYASYKAEGKSLAEETRKAFTLITEVDHLIGEGRGLPEIETFGLNMTGAHAVEESLKEDTQFM